MAALQTVPTGLVGRITKLFAEQGQTQKIATVDQDATIIESHKKTAGFLFPGGLGVESR